MEKCDIKAIIFDMDGVMFNTEKLYTIAFKRITEDMGYGEEITIDFINTCKGRKKEEVKSMYKAKLGQEFDFDMLLERVLLYIDEVIKCNKMPNDKFEFIKPGLKELLKYAKRNGIKMAIATSEIMERVQLYLNLTGVDPASFDAIVTGEMVQNGKPAPDIFVKAADAIPVPIEEAIVLEDSPNGIIAAHNAGAKPIMVIDCIEPIDEIKKLLYIPPVNSLSDVKKMLITKEPSIEI